MIELQDCPLAEDTLVPNGVFVIRSHTGQIGARRRLACPAKEVPGQASCAILDTNAYDLSAPTAFTGPTLTSSSSLSLIFSPAALLRSCLKVETQEQIATSAETMSPVDHQPVLSTAVASGGIPPHLPSPKAPGIAAAAVACPKRQANIRYRTFSRSNPFLVGVRYRAATYRGSHGPNQDISAVGRG